MRKLKQVYNKYLPPKGYTAITILIWMFIREEYKGMLPWWAEVHENIHLRQEIELGFIFFYLIYGLEYIIKLCITWNHLKAYMSISFEQEAYSNQFDKNYLENRKHYAWLKYLFKVNNNNVK